MRTQREMKGQRSNMNLRESANWSGRERRRHVKSSLPVPQIDISQPVTSTEEEGDRNKGDEEASSSDQSAIAVTEGEEIEQKTIKDAECQTIEFDYIFQRSRYQAPNKDHFWHWYYSSLLHWATIYGNTCIRSRLLTCHTANTVSQQISRVHYCTYET